MKKLTDQSEFWDSAAESKDFTHPLDGVRFKRAVPFDAPILDYGCGQGRLCGELSQLGFSNVQGVDYSEKMIQVARSRFPRLNFSVVDGLTLPYDTASFSAVLLFAVLTCIPSDDEQKRLIAEISRVLRPGGLLLVSDYPLQQDERNLKRYELNAGAFGSYGTFRLADGAVVRHHRKSWFAELLAGFVIDSAVEVDGKTMNGNSARILQLWSRRSPLPPCKAQESAS